MGGFPCRAKELMDNFAAAERAAQCARNTVLIVAAAKAGQVPIPPKLAEECKATADAYALACSDLADELNALLPTDEPGG